MVMGRLQVDYGIVIGWLQGGYGVVTELLWGGYGLGVVRECFFWGHKLVMGWLLGG